MILFFDTETTGIWDKRLPPDHPQQPHIVQLACLLTEADGTERAAVNLIVRPDDWDIPSGASAIHGITTEIAQRCGVSEAMVVACWDRLGRISDVMVAHNIEFDWGVMETAAGRTGACNPEVGNGGPDLFCTMQAATPILNMPPTSRMLAVGINKPKPPKLEECIQFWFGEKHEKAHDALADVRACARIYFHMKSLETVAA